MLFDYITKPEFWLFHSIKITEIIAWFIEFLLYIRGSACRRKDRLKPLEPSGPRGSRRTASWRMRKLVDFSESDELISEVKTELEAELTDLTHVRADS